MTAARRQAHEAIRRIDLLARQGRKAGTYEHGLHAARTIVSAVFQVEAPEAAQDEEPVDGERTELELLRRQVDALQAQLARRRLADPEPAQVVDRGRVVARVDDDRREEVKALRADLYAPFNRSKAVMARSAPYPDEKETA